MLTIGKFGDVEKRVNGIAATEKSYMFSPRLEAGGFCEHPDVKRFSSNGLSQLGAKVHFPPQFVSELMSEGHVMLADNIVQTKINDYFLRKPDSEIFFREFADEPVHEDIKNEPKRTIHGVLSSRYSVFDDIEALDILKASDYLMSAESIWYDITPDQFHARFVSPKKLYINGDSSPLSMCVFVDNSMVGKSMFRIRFGLYRWACTNGIISDFKEFCILKERHLGTEKEWQRIVAESILDVKQYEEMLLHKVSDMAVTKSAIYGMTEEDAIRYIKDKLATSKKKARDVLTCYNTVYGAFSKWDLCNAITEVAHDFGDIDTRLSFESKAMRVA